MSGKVMVLVVDDEEIVCAGVRRILSGEGFEVDMVSTAADALQKVREKNYGLVITDLMMPEMNGIELMHAMKEQGAAFPFLMITGYPTIKTAMQALRLGAVDYIPKPFTRQELLSPVNRALRRETSDRPATPRDHFAPQPAAAVPAAASPAAAPKPAAPKPAVPVTGGHQVKSPMPGTIMSIKVKAGDSVVKGTVLCILEAMKMENEIMAPADGTVAQVVTSKGASVNSGDVLLVLS